MTANVREDVGEEQLLFIADGLQINTALVEISVCGGPQRIKKIEPSFDPAILILSTFPKNYTPYHNDTCSFMFTAALFMKGNGPA